MVTACGCKTSFRGSYNRPFFVQQKMDFLREDLTHLFDDQGIDQSAYDDKVNFEDPITRYSTVKGVHLYVPPETCLSCTLGNATWR